MALSNADMNALEGRALLTNVTPLARQAASMQGSCKADRTNNAPWGRNSHTAFRVCNPWVSGRFKSSNTNAQVSVDDKRHIADESAVAM